MKKVSVVIPVYNGEKYIAQAIDSIIKQTHKNIEIIVVNDGSTDKTLEVLKKYESIINLYNQSNKGQSKALNLGWKNSNGDYLTYLSCDDLLHKNCIERLLKFTNEKYSLIYCDYIIIDENNQYVKNVSLGEFNKKKMLENMVCFPGPGTLFKKKDFLEIGGWNTKLSQLPDFEFWIKLLKKGSFYRVPETLSYFRKHIDSGSFKKISISKSNEILKMPFLIKKNYPEINLYKSIYNSLFISLKHHLISKRYLIVIFMFLFILLLNPLFLFKKLFYKIF